MEVIKIEKENLMFQLNGEIPSFPYIEIRVNGVSDEFLVKVKTVMGIMADVNVEDWPDEEYFEIYLPEWFLTVTKRNSFEIIKANPDLHLWHFGSWLDAMKLRNWIWFSSLKTENEIVINIETFNFPYIIEPLEYLIRSTGDVNNYTIIEHTRTSSLSQEWIFKKSKWSYKGKWG